MMKSLLLIAVVAAASYLVLHHHESVAQAPAAEATQTEAPDEPNEDLCTGACYGHDAGYKWAKDKAIDDEDTCDSAGENSNSPSFAEGCKVFVEESQPRPEDTGDQDAS